MRVSGRLSPLVSGLLAVDGGAGHRVSRRTGRKGRVKTVGIRCQRGDKGIAQVAAAG